MIHIPGNTSLQPTEFIIRLEGVDNYTNIYYQNQPKPLLISRSLVYFERQLPDFLRVSKSTIINPAFVARLVKRGKVSHVRLTDDTLVLISRRRVTETVTALNKLRESKSGQPPD